MAAMLQMQFESIFMKENVWILHQISMKFISRGPFDNKSELVQVSA